MKQVIEETGISFMNKLLLLITILFSFNSFSQATKIKIKKEKDKKEKPAKPVYYHHGSVDLYYGNRVYEKSYYNQINSIDNIQFNSPPIIIGVGFSGYGRHIGSLSIAVCQANYYKIIPSRITIDDSLDTKLSGYVAGFAVGWSLSTLKKNLSLSAYFGFNTGRTTLSKNEFISQKNQFFSPKITIQPKFIFKRIAISFILEAEYDVSDPKWRQPIFERKDPYLLQPFHQTCLTGLVSLGYKFY